MNRQDLIKKCSYYKGEKECPADIEKAGKQLIWFHESIWVDFDGDFDDRGEYDAYGLTDFEKDDGVDKNLKGLLFNRFIQDGYDVKSLVEPFKTWYKETYKGSH